MINKIGIIGAGVMGSGVAQVFSEHKFDVMLMDCQESALENASQNIYNTCRLQIFRNREAESADQILKRITNTTELTALSECDFIVENITEEIDSKLQLYQQLDRICKPDIIIAANTSCISITKLAAATNRRKNIIGIHFMNPVPMIHAVEVIKGYYTTEETIQTTIALMRQIHKESIIVKDFPGFVSNRISHLMMNEAAFIIQDSCATARDIDDIFTKCYGHKMGPLETADLIGLDTVVLSLEVLYNSYQDSKFRCCPLLKKMVDAGLLGRKSGEGFYIYK